MNMPERDHRGTRGWDPDMLFRKLRAALLWAALCHAVLPMLAAAETLTVGVPTDRCPIFYRDARTGDVTGIGVDLMRAAAEAAGYEAAFVQITEATLKDALDSEAYDVLMPFGSAIESAAGDQSIVTDNLLQTPFTIVTEGHRELKDLNTLKVGMLRSLGGAAETVRAQYPGMEILLYETMPQGVEALRSGEVDALLHNSYVWSYMLQKPAYASLAVQPSAMFSMDFRAGTRDTDAGRAIVARLNDGIAGLTDTHRQAIILDYTSRRLYRYDLSDVLYRYGLMLILAALLFIAMIVIAIQRRRTMRLEQEERLRELIDHDELTGVYSLNGFRKRVAELLREHPDVPYFISYNNIKNFKYINDSLGMDAGDDLLRFWAKRSVATLSDHECMGRVADDHFVVLRHIGGEEKMRQDEIEVLDPVKYYFVNRGKENLVQICSGVYVLTPEDYKRVDVDHMLDYARVAERRVRETRKAGYEFYNPKQWAWGRKVADVVGHLPVAIRAGELKVWYQPQVRRDTGAVTGMEALCRWDHPTLGWLPPSDFIATLEEADLIYELDRFVWDTVCRDLKRWNEQGHHRSVSVNLSRTDIREDRDIPGHFRDLIKANGLTPDQLRVEITETAFAEDPDLLIDTTRQLRECGFQVEMDDFGSGYSSLHMLKEVPVDRIKLDLHFLTGTGDPERGRIIVSHMIQMVRDLGMELIAEGVERESQAEFLLSRGCNEMQGFYFYKPMPVEQLESTLDKVDAPPS